MSEQKLTRVRLAYTITHWDEVLVEGDTDEEICGNAMRAAAEDDAVEWLNAYDHSGETFVDMIDGAGELEGRRIPTQYSEMFVNHGISAEAVEGYRRILLLVGELMSADKPARMACEIFAPDTVAEMRRLAGVLLAADEAALKALGSKMDAERKAGSENLEVADEQA